MKRLTAMRADRAEVVGWVLEQLALRCEVKMQELHRLSERRRLLDGDDRESARLWRQSREYEQLCRLLRAVAHDELGATGRRVSASFRQSDPREAELGSSEAEHAGEAELDAGVHWLMQSQLSPSAKRRIRSVYRKLRSRADRAREAEARAVASE